MLGIVLKILSILGIVLLALLLLLLLAFLLVLFFPFTYRIQGCKNEDGLRLSIKINWIFGLFRVRYRYPEPGHLTAKALCFSIFDWKLPPEKSPQKSTGVKTGGEGKRAAGKGSARDSSPADGSCAETGSKISTADIADSVQREADGSAAAGGGTINGSNQKEGEMPSEDIRVGIFRKISQKIQKIQYTIFNIYDKIKKIWKNISYYIELLQEENTKQFVSHIMKRMRMILKSIRPRRIRARLLFGMDSPDTTGYLYGIYCMVSALYGGKFVVTPDFQRKIFEGEFDIAGHVTVWVFVINGAKLLLDKRLRWLLKKLKAGQGKARKAPA